MPPILVEFQKSYPRVRFEFQSCTVHTLAQELSAGTIDLAFLLTESVQAASLQSEVLGFEELFLVAHPENPLIRKTSVSYQDLQGQVLLYARTDCDYPLKFQKMLADEKIKLANSMEFNSIEAVKQCVMAGLGFTLMPVVAVRREVESGALSILRSSEDPLEVAVLMVWHKDKWLSPTLDAFLEMVKQKFKGAGKAPSST
jgi:DNA-binding transcriptional LysR family regulator